MPNEEPPKLFTMIMYPEATVAKELNGFYCCFCYVAVFLKWDHYARLTDSPIPVICGWTALTGSACRVWFPIIDSISHWWKGASGLCLSVDIAAIIALCWVASACMNQPFITISSVFVRFRSIADEVIRPHGCAGLSWKENVQTVAYSHHKSKSISSILFTLCLLKYLWLLV